MDTANLIVALVSLLVAVFATALVIIHSNNKIIIKTESHGILYDTGGNPLCDAVIITIINNRQFDTIIDEVGYQFTGLKRRSFLRHRDFRARLADGNESTTFPLTIKGKSSIDICVDPEWINASEHDRYGRIFARTSDGTVVRTRQVPSINHLWR